MILFDEIIFGPIKSRRLGVSLGVNLLPLDGKVCSFDCIYCECGYNAQGKGTTGLPERGKVAYCLEAKLKEMQAFGTAPDVITFAGNGEPTLHPQFPEIIDDTIALRNKYFPKAKISVLSNGTTVQKEKIFLALSKVDNNILKLDSIQKESIELINKPSSPGYNVRNIIDLYKRFGGNIIVQTLFLRGKHQDKIVDNTTDEELTPWLEAIKEIQPESVMIYTIDRETPEKDLIRLSVQELEDIAEKVKALGIPVSISG